MARLVLNTAGIKSPTDVGEEPQRTAPGRSSESTPRRPPRRQPAQSRRPPRAPKPSRQPGTAPFYGTGRPLQTSIALNDDCAARLDELARAAGVSANALAVAAVHAGLPAGADDARAVMVEERVARAGMRAARIERNLRLPEHLRARVDELTSAAQTRAPRATRADLINAALSRGLSGDAQQAAELVADHARRVELAAAA